MLAFASGPSDQLAWAWQSPRVTVVAHDGPVLCGVTNWLRGHIDDLQSVPERWSTEPGWAGIALDEWRLGDAGHRAEDWVWRVAEIRRVCALLGRPVATVALAVGVGWGEGYESVVPALSRVGPVVEELLLECYLDSVHYAKQALRAKQLLDWVVAAGAGARTRVVLNVADRPSWRFFAEYYCPLGDRPGEVTDAYAEVLAHAYGHGISRWGYWGASYATARSRAVLESLEVG